MDGSGGSGRSEPPVGAETQDEAASHAVESMRVGVVVEKRALNNRWVKHEWRPVAVVPGAPELADWTELGSGEGWTQYHARSMDLQLFRKETEGYKRTLSQNPSAVFVVMRPLEDDLDREHEVEVFHVTVCPYEAESYEVSGEESVEGVVMPDLMRAWMQAFVAENHKDEPFYKRKRKPYDPRKGRGPGSPGQRSGGPGSAGRGSGGRGS